MYWSYRRQSGKQWHDEFGTQHGLGYWSISGPAALICQAHPSLLVPRTLMLLFQRYVCMFEGTLFGDTEH
jgi:hypothetical protein